MDATEPLRLERIDQVLSRRASKRSKLYDDISTGRWTPPIRIGRASSWPAHETEKLLAAHIAGATEEQIKGLVQDLLEQRRALMPRLGSSAA
jgi:prophage regulatory protein